MNSIEVNATYNNQNIVFQYFTMTAAWLSHLFEIILPAPFAYQTLRATNHVGHFQVNNDMIAQMDSPR